MPARLYVRRNQGNAEGGLRTDETAPPVIHRMHRKDAAPNPLHGLFERTIGGKRCAVEYEPEDDLRDTG